MLSLSHAMVSNVNKFDNLMESVEYSINNL